MPGPPSNREWGAWPSAAKKRALRDTPPVNGSASFRLPAFAAMTFAALTIGHELTYLAVHGPGEGYARAMAEGGHERYWTTFVLAIASMVGGLGVVAAVQIRRLHRHAVAVGTETSGLRERRGEWLSILGRLWLRLGLAAGGLFLLQENLERAAIGEGPPVLGVFLADQIIALPLLAAASLLVAAVGALFAWRRDIYLDRIRLAAAWRRREESSLRPNSRVERLLDRLLGRQNGTRAPPVGTQALA